MGMLIHCGGERVPMRKLAEVPLPEATDTYYPISHTAIAELLRETVTELGEVTEEEYALNREGAHAFGLLSLKVGDGSGADYRQLVVGWRNSYDRSIAVGIGSGDRMLVCDNLCFRGSGYTAIRRHTRHGWEDVQRMAEEAVSTARMTWRDTGLFYEALREVDVDTIEGFRLIGHALGEKVLTPTQANRAMRDWRTPRHDAFRERTGFSLYNCVTEGLKKGSASDLIPRNIRATHWFSRALNVQPQHAPALAE